MGKSRNRKIKGFTLIEALIAIVILTSIGIGIISTVIYAKYQVEIENQRTKALILASKTMEVLQRTYIPSIMGFTSNVIIDDNGTVETTDDLPGTLQVVVKDKNGNVLTSPPPGDNYIRVEVYVRWHPAGNPSGKLLEESLISEIAPRRSEP